MTSKALSNQHELEKRNKILERRWKIFLILAIVFLLTRPVALFIVNNFIHKAAENALVNDHSFLDPALPFYEKKDLIVNIQELREYLKSLPDKNKDWADMSIYFEVLNTGANISVNPETTILPASLMKLPAGMVAMKKVEKGEWSLDTQFTLLREDADLRDTPDVEAQIGRAFSLSFLLNRMLLESDNTSYKMIVRQFTREELFSLPEAVGLDNAFIYDRKIGAKEYTRMFRALYSATYLNEEHSQQLLNLLVKSQAQDLLKAGIPAEVPFAHKWGTNEVENVYSDSGIVYLDKRPYLISVMVAGKSSDHKSDRAKATSLMKEIAEHAYNFVSSR